MLMDELQRLVDLYHRRAASSAQSKLDVLMDLERIRDPRVVPFLLKCLEDRQESAEVRIHVIRQLRTGTRLLVPADRPEVAKVLVGILTGASAEHLRIHAALTLGDFADMDGVLSSLSTVSLARDESIDLRYAAFTAIERAGPTPEGIAELRRISDDETLGHAARSILSAWHVR